MRTVVGAKRVRVERNAPTPGAHPNLPRRRACAHASRVRTRTHRTRLESARAGRGGEGASFAREA